MEQLAATVPGRDPLCCHSSISNTAGLQILNVFMLLFNCSSYKPNAGLANFCIYRQLCDKAIYQYYWELFS